MLKPTRALAVTGVAALLALAGCGSGEPSASAPETAAPETTASAAATPSASPTAQRKKVEAAKNLDSITVTGKKGAAPKVEFKAPFAVEKTMTKVLQKGDGAEVSPDGTVEVHYQGVNGYTGKVFDESFTKKQSVKFPLAQVIPGFKNGLAGQRVGSRVLVAMPGKDGYDSAGGSAQAGIEVGDTLLFVVDIVSTTLDAPQGTKVAAKAGLPSVSDGAKPTVRIPKGDPPTKLTVQPLIKGDGAKVTEADAVTVRYTAVSWKSGKEVDGNFGKAPQTGPLSGLIPGWQQGLVGQNVGSRMLLVVPPQLAYPDGNATPKIDKGETLVFVVDLLYAAPAQ